MTYKVLLNGKQGRTPEGRLASHATKDTAKVAVMDLILALVEGDPGHMIKAMGNDQFLVYHHGGVDAVDIVED
jgi:hypothetical protein